jgi:glutathione peroxidase
MNHLLYISLAAALSLGCFNSVQVAPVTNSTSAPAMSFHELTAIDINGKPFAMSQLKGKKVMVVNTASECGYTPQYQQLQELYEAYRDKGLVIIGFPCNDFGGQEPGSEAEIAQFCEKNYGVTFPMMSKVHTKGEAQHPVYQWLTSKAQNGVMDSAVKWNFHKFLIDADGRLVKSLGSGVGPFDEEVISWLK